MSLKVLSNIHKWLQRLAFALGIIFAIMFLGHTIYLIGEYIFAPEKSIKRWEQIEQKFERHHYIKNDSIHHYQERN